MELFSVYVLSDTKSQLESQFHFGSNKDDELSGSSIIELSSKIVLQFNPVIYIYGTGKSIEWQFHIVFKHNSV